MHSLLREPDLENWHDFEVASRREITALLRGIGEKNQLIRMLVHGESDVCVTSILDVLPDDNTVILDCSIDREQNQRILSARAVSFETTLDKIRILFSAERVEQASFEGNPALKIALPATLIRLQRREFYRMATPVSNPVRVVITLPAELAAAAAPSRWPTSAAAGSPSSTIKWCSAIPSARTTPIAASICRRSAR